MGKSWPGSCRSVLRATAGDDNREMEKSYSCFPESRDQLKHPFPQGRRGKSSLQTHRPMRLIKASSITVRANNSGESYHKPSFGWQSLAALRCALPLPNASSGEWKGSRGGYRCQADGEGKQEPVGGDEISHRIPGATRPCRSILMASTGWRGGHRLDWKETWKGGGGPP